jgi:uncharacterized membrane protein
MKNSTLSKNYSILKTFQWLVGILILASAIVFMQYISEYGDILSDEQMVCYIGLYVYGVFWSICIILIVSFLFDLDRHKSNYTAADEEKETIDVKWFDDYDIRVKELNTGKIKTIKRSDWKKIITDGEQNMYEVIYN